MPRRELGLDERQGVEWCIRVQGVVVLSLLGLRPQKRADHRHRYLSTTTALRLNPKRRVGVGASRDGFAGGSTE